MQQVEESVVELCTTTMAINMVVAVAVIKTLEKVQSATGRYCDCDCV